MFIVELIVELNTKSQDTKLLSETLCETAVTKHKKLT